MQNLLWSAFNLVLFAGLVYIFFRAAKLVRQHIGWLATIFFGVGLTIIGSRPTSSASDNNNLLSNIPKNAPLGNASRLKLLPLGSNNALNLLAEYHEDNGHVRPRGLYASVSGFLLGHTWQPLTGALEQRGSQLHYIAVANHGWNLLGFQVFNQNTNFEGSMPAKAAL
jgi:hypothetical protein